MRWPVTAGFSWLRVLAVVGTLALVGAFDEAHQEWIPGRKMDAADFAADVAGALAGATVSGLTGRGRSG